MTIICATDFCKPAAEALDVAAAIAIKRGERLLRRKPMLVVPDPAW
jgi:hypothetical protein